MVQIILIFIIMLFISKIYGFIFTLSFFTRKLYLLFAVIAIFLYFYSYHNKSYRRSIFVKEFLFLYLWSFVPALTTGLVGGDLIDEFLNGLAFSFTAVAYPLFFKLKIRENIIISAFSLFSMVAVFLQVIIQLHPEFAFFGALTEEDIVWNMRNNLYRIRPGCIQMTVLCCLYFWCKLIKNIKLLYLVLFFTFLTGMYLELTRQVLMGFGLSLFYIIYVGRKTGLNKKLIVFLSVCFCVIIYNYWDALFGDLINDYKEDTFTTDIRKKCIAFTLNQLIQSPVVSWFGHGHLQIEPTVWWKKGFFMSDIGFIGEAFYKGIIWSLVFFRMVYLILYKYRKHIPIYIKAFVVAVGSISVFMFPYSYQNSLLVWVSVLYISSLHIKHNYNVQ